MQEDLHVSQEGKPWDETVLPSFKERIFREQ